MRSRGGIFFGALFPLLKIPLNIHVDIFSPKYYELA